MFTSPLQQRIVDRIQQDGPLTFADYMYMALYEPGYGYYVRDATRTGWEGDFYTSTNISDFFAHCVGRQLYQMWEQLACPVPFVVLEQGAGRGNLARGVCAWAAQEASPFQAALNYRTEDICTGHDALQAPFEESSDNEHVPHVILSNELVDAFPVHIVEKHDGKLYEIYVDWQNGCLREILGKPSSTEVACYLDRYQIPWTTFAEGWRAEINLDALRWMKRTAQLLAGPAKKRSFLLTIDYGDRASALYTGERLRGTLTCYSQHQLSESPLIRPGEQDITTHVNFSALIDEGERYGLSLQTFTTQELWLKEMGIHDELARIRARDFAIIETERASDQGQIALLQWYNLRQQVSALIDPAGMGKFKVLMLRGLP
jgi:SAM-dependent MidA family methyltransferase